MVLGGMGQLRVVGNDQKGWEMIGNGWKMVGQKKLGNSQKVIENGSP